MVCSQSAQPRGSGRPGLGQRRGCGLAGGWAHCLVGPWGWRLPWELRADQWPSPPAVQEERQRGKDRGEGEVESTSSANEDMPVEKILEAELAVEPKTETYVEASVGLNPSSVSTLPTPVCSALGAGPWERTREGDPIISSPPPAWRGTPSSHHLRLGARLGGGPRHHTPPGSAPGGVPVTTTPAWEHAWRGPVTPCPTSMRLCCPSGGRVFGSKLRT